MTEPQMFNKPIRDIRKKDVDEAIRMMAEKQEMNVSMKIKKPVEVDMDMFGEVYIHVYNHGENDDFFLKISAGLLALSGVAFLFWWMVLR